MSGQAAFSNSSGVTNRPGCSTRYRSTAKVLGVRGIARVPRHTHSLAVSRRRAGVKCFSGFTGFRYLNITKLLPLYYDFLRRLRILPSHREPAVSGRQPYTTARDE